MAKLVAKFAFVFVAHFLPIVVQHIDWYNGTNATYAMSLVSLVPPPSPSAAPGPLSTHVLVGALGMGMAFSPDDGASWVRVSSPIVGGVAVTLPWRFLRAPNGTAYVGADAHDVTHGWPSSRVLVVTGA